MNPFVKRPIPGAAGASYPAGSAPDNPPLQEAIEAPLR
jgi:hypothetical protein